MDYVDLIFCHRPDPNTPVEETVWAMHDIVSPGKALYWGTSEWSAAEIMAAWQIADRHHLHKPQMEQPQYNMLWRNRVEKEYARLYDDIGLGLTIWSPLASGLLTGKYAAGLPADSRAALPRMSFLVEGLTDPAKNAAVGALEAIAQELGCTLSQLAIAWCARNPHVSSVITGASRVEQVKEKPPGDRLRDQAHRASPRAHRGDRRRALRVAFPHAEFDRRQEQGGRAAA